MLRTRRRRIDERGYTLIELLVVLVVFAVAGGITMAAILSGLNASRTAERNFTDLSELKRSVERVARELRAADGLMMDPGMDFDHRLGATIYRGNEKFVHWFYVGGGALLQDTETYANTTDTTPASTETGVLIAELDDPTRTVFHYEDDEGEPIPDVLDRTLGGHDCSTMSGEDKATCVTAYGTSPVIEVVLDDAPVKVSTKVLVRRTQLGG